MLCLTDSDHAIVHILRAYLRRLNRRDANQCRRLRAPYRALHELETPLLQQPQHPDVFPGTSIGCASSRCTIWRSWNARPEPWTSRFHSKAGSCRRASGCCAGGWKRLRAARAPDPPVLGDFLLPVVDAHPLAVALDHHLPVGAAHRHRVVVAVETHQRQAAGPGRLKVRLWQPLNHAQLLGQQLPLAAALASQAPLQVLPARLLQPRVERPHPMSARNAA